MSPRDIKYATMYLSGKSSYEKDNDMPNEKKGNEEHGVRLSYKFRIYPTPSQCEAIKANIDASRFVYNHYLRARMDAYERTQQEVRRPKPACDEQGNVQYDQDGKEIWERLSQAVLNIHGLQKVNILMEQCTHVHLLEQKLVVVLELLFVDGYLISVDL